MKVVPKKLGGNPKQYAILGGLVVVLIVVFLMNRSSTPDVAPARPQGAIPGLANPAGPRTAAPEISTSPRVPQRSQRGAGSTEEFRPSIKLKEGMDVSRIDPTLKLDLLAKLEHVPIEGGSRSLFELGQPPAPAPPKVADIKPVTPPEPVKPPPPASTEPPKPAEPPPPPPINIKFYGYVNPQQKVGVKRAFFLDGEDIFVAGENDLIRNRYKVVRIGVNSAVVEDTSNKNQQTLPLVEELAG
jgi:hypothetical protein